MVVELLRWIPSIIGLLITGFNAGIWIVVKFNDLKHLEDNVKELTDLLKETNKTMSNNAERLSRIEGRCTANHP